MKKVKEFIAQILFWICAVIAILAVSSITVYMIVKGAPALGQIGVSELLFSPVWKPTAAEPSYGIFYIILSSVVGTGAAVLIGMPIGIFSAVFLSELADKKLGTRCC